ncbi:MAG: hypothetical protein U5N85_09600 [Arcicella sp.]|nr:hypothetical protein [Arcicella sp.]
MKKYLALLFCVVSFYTNAQQTISDWKYQKDFSSNPTNFIKAGKKIYFLATTPEHGQELWVTESTSESTKLVKDIMVGENGAFTSKDYYGGSGYNRFPYLSVVFRRTLRMKNESRVSVTRSSSKKMAYWHKTFTAIIIYCT